MATTQDVSARQDTDRLRSLIPLESLNEEGFERIAGAMTLRRVKAGTILFRFSKRNEYTLYLLEGAVELEDFDTSKRVEAGTERALRPLVDAKPNDSTGTAVTDCVVAVIDSALMERYLAWEQMARRPVPGLEVQEFEGTDNVEWTLQMLQTKVFTQLPTGNIQSLFLRFEEFPVTEGQVVIKQGDPGDYYYIITRGRCRVTRTAGTNENTSTLAELGPRDTFGEEALVSDAPRNATVTMLTEGVLMRLAKEDFRQLMTAPLVKLVEPQAMQTLMREGAVVLDVRLESEFKNGSVRDAYNIPLYLLRLKAASLDKNQCYIVVCDTGARSAAAAFLLSERGLDVRALDGGLAALVPG